ncbi:outer membrane lipoprotein-sorting protein [Myxococcota bacterium]|nr:outer membrane lipoprotein-sorting protein [Myxococcota bacterium]
MRSPQAQRCFTARSTKTAFVAMLGTAALFLSIAPTYAQDKITPEEIIRRMDKNHVFESRESHTIMRIHRYGRTRESHMRSYSKGEDSSYTEFLSPARDKGIKYLKLRNNLWMYMPSAEKVLKISGHMLRQSMMGSDFSYEDMLDSTALRDRYNKELVGEEAVNGQLCYVLKLTQKNQGETYPTRKVWIHKTQFVTLKSELFAVSGRLLKVMTLSNVKQYGERYYPTVVRMENKLRRGTWTEATMKTIKFKVQLPEQIFSLRNLQRD